MVVSIGPLESLLTRDEWVALIEHVGRGDKTAFAVFYDATAPLVFGLVLMIVGDRIAAEEITLDVYTAAWKTAPSYDKRQGTPLTWLLSIARGKAMARLNRPAHHHSDLDPEDDLLTFSPEMPTQYPALSGTERLENAGLALETMPAEEREALELAYFEGLNPGEIAARLGRPSTKVKTQVMRAMSKLLESLCVGKGGSDETSIS